MAMPRLLLVDDAVEAALLVERLGRRIGLEVVHRMDVPSAWSCVCQALPDLILLDLNLIGERGETLCRQVRTTAETAAVPIALFVHWQCPEDIVSGLEAGADYVVAKDLLCRPEQWQARLKEILAPRDGLDTRLSLSCQHNKLLPSPSLEGLGALNLALRHPLMRQLGSAMVRFLLRQAGAGSVPGGEGEKWLEADGLALDVRHVATAGRSEAVVIFAEAVAELLQRLLGTEASAPVRDALRTAVNRLSG
jgi:DNA-binding response OmpR family regulator